LCLASIRKQSYPSDLIEIIIADAGSTDATLEIAKKYHADKIIFNPLKTGEAGKAYAIEISRGEICALVDSDNVFEDREFFTKAGRVFRDPGIDCTEPIGWTLNPHDSLVDRYCALLGMNDPLCYFLGNYNRYSYLSQTFTRMNLLSQKDTPDALIVGVSPYAIPTFGANGFMIRRAILEKLSWKPYYFDIDVFGQAVRKGHNCIALLKTETHHLYCDTIATFHRKQARRIRDFLYHTRHNNRTHSYRSVSKINYFAFIFATITIFPLMWQSMKGYHHKKDSAWWFHPLACWITLWAYMWGICLSLIKPKEFDRSSWKQ
jgi:glycosyltransferase involved in cell wall biosynthesis